MEIPFSFGHAKKDEGVISLKRMIARQLCWFQPIAVKRNSLIINDVPADFRVTANKNLLATVIYNLLESMVRKTSYSCIRLSVRRYGNTILFRLADSGTIQVQSLDLNWQKIKSVAESLGGCVITSDMNRKNLAVTLSFQCMSSAA